MSLKHFIINTLTLLSILLFASCNTSKTTPKAANKTTNTTDSSIVKKMNHPILISPQKFENIIYKNLPNHIKVHTPEGHSKNIEFSAPGCLVDTIDKEKGIYSLRTGRPGLLIEAVAKDRESDKLAFAKFEVVEIPAPSATIGVYRQPIKEEIITSTTIKLKSALILVQRKGVPVRCNATSFKLTRIDSEGKREIVVNEDALGNFEDKTVSLINKAKSGDIYIFSDIINNCSKKKVQNIVYILEN